MHTETPGYSRQVLRLLEDEDLEGLLELLRQPARPNLRAEAALALGELGDYEATELLVRASREDPEAPVRAAAQQALLTLHGNEAPNVIASYSGASAPDAWLLEPAETAADDDDEQESSFPLDEQELEGYVRIARYETSKRLRLRALRVLGRSPGPVSANTLAELALWGDFGKLRQAARQALEEFYGDSAAEVLESYRQAALEEARASGTEEELLEKMELEFETSEDEEDDEEEDDYAEDEELDEDEEEEIEEEIEEEEQADDALPEKDHELDNTMSTPETGSPPALRAPSPYLHQNQAPVTEEVGVPRWLIALGLICLALLLYWLLAGW